MFGRTASKKPSRLLSDQLIAFKFAVKLLDDLSVEPGMKMVHHGITLPPKLLDARLSSYSRQFKHVTLVIPDSACSDADQPDNHRTDDDAHQSLSGDIFSGDCDRPMSLPPNGDAPMYPGSSVKLSTMAATPFSVPSGGRFATEPSLDEFEAIAAKAFGQLPQKFRALCEDLVIRVEDFPSDEIVQQMKAKSKFQLLGLFRGVGLPFRFESAPTRMPNMIWLYRRPILSYWGRHQDTLEAIITHVLVHEIGHHFGFSDDDMHGIEDRAD